MGCLWFAFILFLLVLFLWEGYPTSPPACITAFRTALILNSSLSQGPFQSVLANTLLSAEQKQLQTGLRNSTWPRFQPDSVPQWAGTTKKTQELGRALFPLLTSAHVWGPASCSLFSSPTALSHLPYTLFLNRQLPKLLTVLHYTQGQNGPGPLFAGLKTLFHP